MSAQQGYWPTHTVVFAWMDSWSKCQYCWMLLTSCVTIFKIESQYCYHTQNKSKNNNKFSKNDKKVRTDNFFNQWLWVTQWLSDLQRYCKQTGLALQPAAWHHFKVIPDSSRTIWPSLCIVLQLLSHKLQQDHLICLSSVQDSYIRGSVECKYLGFIVRFMNVKSAKGRPEKGSLQISFNVPWSITEVLVA